jgi:RsiW-degrading membrane proteinase PrsW (M82 family)
LLSKGKDLLAKGFLVPALVTVITVVALFATMQRPIFFIVILGIYIGLTVLYAVLKICGRSKPLWVLASSTVLTIVLTVLWSIVVSIAHFPDAPSGILAGLGTAGNFIFHFVRAGLPEEIIKSLPVFAALLLGYRLTSKRRHQVEVREPLDGIIIGAASGLGFTLAETFLGYIPLQTVLTSQSVTEQATEIVRQVLGVNDAGSALLSQLIGQSIGEKLGPQVGLMAGSQLLIPRTLGAIHVALSAYFGYFIGLSNLKTNQRWKILSIGYLSASALHGFWNASGDVLSGWFLVVPGTLLVVCFGSAILKARQLAGLRSSLFLNPISVPAAANPHVETEPSQPSTLQVGPLRIQLTPGAKIRETEIPGLIARAQDGIVAEINRNPNEPSMLGLMNLSVNPWFVKDPRRGVLKLEPGRSVRLAAGTRINFGSIFGEVQ